MAVALRKVLESHVACRSMDCLLLGLVPMTRTADFLVCIFFRMAGSSCRQLPKNHKPGRFPCEDQSLWPGPMRGFICHFVLQVSGSLLTTKSLTYCRWCFLTSPCPHGAYTSTWNSAANQVAIPAAHSTSSRWLAMVGPHASSDRRLDRPKAPSAWLERAFTSAMQPCLEGDER